MMWRLALTLTLFCWGSEATVTCRDNNNGEVDWYILYKAPRKRDPKTGEYLKEISYLYIDPRGTAAITPSSNNYKNINHPYGILANTLQPIFTRIKLMPPNFGFISYSDQPPGCRAQDTFGHSKGVLMMEKDNMGVWLLHSTPQFPFRRNRDHFWPESGWKNAQTFICVTFPYSQFRQIGTHLKYIGAFPFEHDIPPDFHRELTDATNWVQETAASNLQALTSRGGQSFHSIAKQQSTVLTDGDLYFTLANLFRSDVLVQTWGCQHGRACSYCLANYKVKNTKAITTAVDHWKISDDHSKWCVTTDQNRFWTCIADVNRAQTQYKRRGGALCINDERITRQFRQFAGVPEDCPTQPYDQLNIMDCDPDPGLPSDTRMG